MRFLPFPTATVLLTVFLLAAPAQAEQDATPRTPAAPAASTASYRGNVKSKVFHTAGCRYFNSKSCTAHFASAEEARNGGYQPCKLCLRKERKPN